MQQISSMERFWDGVTKEQFYYRFQTSQKNMNDFVTLTDSIAKELRHNEDASISALRHVYQHFLDDKAKGFPSLDVTYEFKNRIIMELRAYMVEIKI